MRIARHRCSRWRLLAVRRLSRMVMAGILVPAWERIPQIWTVLRLGLLALRSERAHKYPHSPGVVRQFDRVLLHHADDG